MLDKIREEPVLVTSLIAAVLYALTEFGIEVTDGQQAGILGVAGAVLAFIARGQVEPVAKQSPAHRG